MALTVLGAAASHPVAIASRFLPLVQSVCACGSRRTSTQARAAAPHFFEMPTTRNKPQVACHAIFENLHRFQAMTKGYERAIFSPESPLHRSLRALEAADADGSIALRLELAAHFMRAYTGSNVSPHVIDVLHDRCAAPCTSS